AVVGPLAAETALLDAAEGGGRVGDQSAVETDHACFELFGDAQATGEVAGIEIGDEAVFRVVCRSDRLLPGIEDGDRGDGTEDFVVHDQRVRLHAGEDGGREVEAVAAGRLTAGHDGSAARLGVAYQAGDALDGVLVDQRPALRGGIVALADLQR